MAILAVLLLFVSTAAPAADFKSDKEKKSYAIGMKIGNDFKSQGLDISPEVLVQGITDTLAENNMRLSDDEARQVITALQQEIMQRRQQQSQELAGKNLEEAEAFLEKNKKAKGVKQTESGLQYIVLQEGKGKMPKATDKVKVHYTGTLLNGEKFDSSYDRGEPATFGVNAVIKGWTEALQLMKEGGKLKIFIPPSIGYGERGAGARIPPNSALVFEVELLEVL
ncbi:MAG: hypothetical protein C0616_08725 [Desulfuromonas sp.]|nr:MAG: hypothetical protein C0616_08725 [Desulfuromonas sp.]